MNSTTLSLKDLLGAFSIKEASKGKQLANRLALVAAMECELLCISELENVNAIEYEKRLEDFGIAITFKGLTIPLAMSNLDMYEAFLEFMERYASIACE